jgi:RNA polymerase sigma-70 factor (ECF subfamily)
VTTNPASLEGAFGCVMRAWRAHEAELLAFLRHQTGDPHRAEDVLQEVFLKAMRHGKRFCEVEQPRAWLFQVARTSLIDEVRRQRAAEPLDDQLPAPATDDASPVDALAECIERTLPRLDPADEDVLRRCDLDGWRQQDYADRNGLTLAATKARLRRARRRLRAQLIERCGVRFDEQGVVCCTVPPVRTAD